MSYKGSLSTAKVDLINAAGALGPLALEHQQALARDPDIPAEIADALKA